MHVEDALHPQDVGPFLRQHGPEPVAQPGLVEVSGLDERDGLDRGIVLVVMAVPGRVPPGLQVEGSHLQQLADVHLGVSGRVHTGRGVQFPKPDGQRIGFLRRDEVGLVQQDGVRAGDLFTGLVVGAELLLNVHAVHHRHHGLKLEIQANPFVQQQGLHDDRGVREAGGFHHQIVEGLAPFHELQQHPQQVSLDGAADAAVVHLEDLFFRRHDEVVVDADLAELVDDHGDAVSVRRGEDAVQQRGLAGPRKPVRMTTGILAMLRFREGTRARVTDANGSARSPGPFSWVYFPSRSSSAQNTRSGVSGSSRIRDLMASATALPMAAGVGARPGSPSPLGAVGGPRVRRTRR